jgi:hypothetical protein
VFLLFFPLKDSTVSACHQDAASKVQDAAATNYDFAKGKASDIASAASDKAHEAKGDAQVG